MKLDLFLKYYYADDDYCCVSRLKPVGPKNFRTRTRTVLLNLLIKFSNLTLIVAPTMRDFSWMKGTIIKRNSKKITICIKCFFGSEPGQHKIFRHEENEGWAWISWLFSAITKDFSIRNKAEKSVVDYTY